ncbi:hypothetical protein DICSQDRAFT_180170 [Dichomitus squalens LYAD-421 SS1]|uniref:DH domain-containing protein n=1 Tax=Dichomitus squalens (strain LYAD-421) TaxID=732165 RepID=R7T1I5_DICSQ|nr:uncharacterized protein DICSQDRAFT_180170 [Dichomitus squalens LYAD-421 SS1]EJF62299.1 hypothetical protein DICSQDRAFT_180170 [Dichomitus squalens LYAD-421 SS1]
MASPTLTPEVAHASTSTAMLEAAPRQLVPTPGHANMSSTNLGGSPVMTPPSAAAASGEDHVSHHPSPPNPTWTTSPPTPPPKQPPAPRLAPATPLSPTSSSPRADDRSAHGPRPASLPPFTSSPSAQDQVPASATSPVLAALSSNSSRVRASTRRMSLPVDFAKPLPPRPALRADGAPKELPPPPHTSENTPVYRGEEEDADPSLPPSLTRRALASPTRGVSRARMGASETGLKGVGRKLFDLDLGMDEGDVSDEDEAEHLPGAVKEGEGEEKRPARESDNRPPEHADMPDQDLQPRDTELGLEREAEMGRARQKERAEGLRRYHALMELLTTEVGYLLDLRALVTVYLDQLLLLSTPPTTPGSAGPSAFAPPPPPASQQCLSLPAPSRSTSTFSALSIPSLFPSSRSSFLQPSPAPTPSVSASDYLSNSTSDCSSVQERERHTSCPHPTADAAARERDKDSSSRLLTLRPGKSRSFAPLMPEKDARAVCRNAQDLLKYHERLVEELRDTVSVTTFRVAFAQGGESGEQRAEDVVAAEEEVERAIELVAAKFVDEASAFGIYETFCPGHNAAGDVVRRAQERAPAAWDAYEHKCAALLSSISPGSLSDAVEEADVSSPTSPVSEEDAMESFSTKTKRRHSTPISFPTGALDLGARGQLPFPTAGPATAAVPLPALERRVRWTGRRLKLTDYLIKPVQRICKYPLLLDQLKKRTLRDPAEDEDTPTEATTTWHGLSGDTLRRALEAMRDVTSRVNRASEKEAHNLRSALIHSRLAFANPPPPPPPASAGPSSSGSSGQPSAASTPSSSEYAPSHGHSNSASSGSGASTAPTFSCSVCTPTAPLVPVQAQASAPRAAYLTADFVSSLGPCLLVGALDVVQYPVQRAKYLGAFLYAGGYCILAKIPKGGRVYEPRHWFALSEVEVVDIEEDDPSYPYTFRVSAYGHHLELAASCPQEKAIWMAAINDALATKRTWAREPFSSLQTDEKVPSVVLVDDAPPELNPESARRLSTIQSNSELEKEGEVEHENASSLPSPAKLRCSKTMFRLDGIPTKPEHHSQVATFSAALSRRSSTASVKAFFAPIAFDSRISRPTGQIRSQVEGGLHDVFSESCLAARAQAQMRGEDLFQVRVPGSGKNRQPAGVTRSSSGISIASLSFSAARRKYDNVVVHRRKGLIDLDLPAPPVAPLPTGYATSTVADAGAPAAKQDSGGLSLRAKSLAARRHKKPPSSIAPAIYTAIAQMNAEQQGQPAGPYIQSPEPLSLDSPPDASRCSSASSALPSPVETSPLPIPTPGISPNGTVRDTDPSRGREGVPKRSRFVVYNVRTFFQTPRSLSRSASSSSGRTSPNPPVIADSPSSPAHTSSGLMQWIRRASLRGRASASSSSSSANSMIDVHMGHEELRRPMRSRTSMDSVAMRSQYLDVPQPHGARVYDYSSSPKRHKSLFVSSSRAKENGVGFRDDTLSRKDPQDPTTGSTGGLSARKSLRNILLFQRRTAMTPVNPALGR